MREILNSGIFRCVMLHLSVATAGLGGFLFCTRFVFFNLSLGIFYVRLFVGDNMLRSKTRRMYTYWLLSRSLYPPIGHVVDLPFVFASKRNARILERLIWGFFIFGAGQRGLPPTRQPAFLL